MEYMESDEGDGQPLLDDFTDARKQSCAIRWILAENRFWDHHLMFLVMFLRAAQLQFRKQAQYRHTMLDDSD